MEALPATKEALEAKGTEVVVLGGKTWGALDGDATLRVVEAIRDWSPDLVHGAVFEGVWQGTRAGRRTGVPVIAEETGDPSIRSFRGDLLMALAFRRAEMSVAISPFVERYLRDRLRLRAERVVRIDNAVPPPIRLDEEQTLRLRDQLTIPRDHLVIGCVGRLDNDHKRYSDLLEAVASLGDSPPVTLLLVGEGPDRELVERRVAQLQLDGRVRLVGHQPDPGPYYGLMDIFALASRQEAFGLVLAEAMHCGLPVAATRVGGIPYVVEDGRTALLVEPHRPEQMAEALRKLIADPDLRERLGKAGQSRARARFHSDRYVEDVADLYRRLSGSVK